MGATEVVDRVTSTVTYLRVTVGSEETPADWLSCEELVSEPQALGIWPGRRPPVGGPIASRWPCRCWSRGTPSASPRWPSAPGCSGDVVLDIAPAHTAIAIGRHRPNAVRFDELRLVATDDPLATLRTQLFDSHLGRLVANCPRLRRGR